MRGCSGGKWIVLLKLLLLDFALRRDGCSRWYRGRAVRFESLPSTHVCQTCMGVFELRGFHLDDRVRKNVAIYSLCKVYLLE